MFDLNDFDDTIIAPWRYDVLRLTTSLLLGGRELGVDGVEVLDLADALLAAWSDAAFGGAELPKKKPPCVEALLGQAEKQTRGSLLKGRTELVDGERHFVRGPRYAELPKDVRAAVPKVFEEYFATIAEAERPNPAKCSLRIEDAALRIAGTGSLGGLRIAVLIEGRGGHEGGWIFDLKEQGTPSAAALVAPPPLAPAERVIAGYRACLEHPPRALGSAKLGHLSLFGRRLAPQEDKLDLASVEKPELPALAGWLGALLGRAHARGATKKPSSHWSKSDREHVRQLAVRLAGMHEATYLALCERMRPLVAKK